MNIVLFGTTDITQIVANELKINGYKISAIVTSAQEFSISYSKNSVNNARFVNLEAWAEKNKTPIFTYSSATKIIEEFQKKNIATEFAVIAGWYYMVPQKLRDIFPMGCSAFHASLLPQLRGGAPLNWAILLGLKKTGVSFFELSDGVDDGLLYSQEEFEILETDYIEDLIKKSTSSILSMLKRDLPPYQEWGKKAEKTDW